MSKLSAVLVKNGIRKGDTVLIYMPMITETLVAMLATIRIGAAHSVVFGGNGLEGCFPLSKKNCSSPTT